MCNCWKRTCTAARYHRAKLTGTCQMKCVVPVHIQSSSR